MKQEIRLMSSPSQRIFTEMECGHLLDNYVSQISKDQQQNTCGVLISGYTGTGKTFFVEHFLQKFDANNAILIARHYQQHEHIPYYGFKNSISDYLTKLYSTTGKHEFLHFSNSLKKHLGDSFPLLLDYIPELSILSGDNARISKRSLVTMENQLYSLFKRLFEFLADFYHTPVLFFTDDLQWIDASGTNLLKYLLLNLSSEKLIWIGAYRAPQHNQSLVQQLVEELHLKDRIIENIILNGLTHAELKKSIESMLGKKPHADLADVCYKLTGGNPSHLQALVDNLVQKNHLWVENDEWYCNPTEVENHYAGQNAERIVFGNVKKLSAKTHEIVCMVACLGRSSKDMLLKWLDGDGLLMEQVLSEARNMGLLEYDDQDVRFVEMHIGEMIYNELSLAIRSDLHYRLAELFYSRGIDRLTAADVVLMATSYNHSIERVKENGELEKSAMINYKAGKISEQDNSLEQARYFYKMSAEHLKECSWDGVRDQVWLVYLDRARIEYYLGEYDLAEIHLDYLLELLDDPLQRAKAFELKITINNRLGRYQKVVHIVKGILNEFGLELPLEENVLREEVNQLTAALNDQEDGNIRKQASSILNPEYDEAILKLLYVGGMGMHHTSDVLMRWAALQIMLRPVINNPSVVKAIGYVSYGRMLIISGDIDKGFDFGLKGVGINNSLQDITMRCRVYGVFAFYIQPWKKSFSESKGLLKEAMEAGRVAGDLIGLYILKTHALNLHIISGLPLRDFNQWTFDESYPGNELTYYITHYQKNLVLFLKGEAAIFSMPRQHPSSLAARLTLQEEKFYRNYVWAKYYFLFGHYELAAKAAREAHNNRKLQEGSPLLPANLMTWFLAITQDWNNHNPSSLNGLTLKVNVILKSFAFWQHQAPSNYRAAYLLLKAEWARIEGEEKIAISLYSESLAHAGTNVYHAAIVHEFLGKYLLTQPTGRKTSLDHLVQAIQSFTEWGASAKAKQLIQHYQAVLSDRFPDPGYMDIETIQYELSGDLEVASLVKKLMVLLLRISGSTHVVVELMENSGERILYDQLSLLNDPDTSKKRGNIAIPASMILLAIKSTKTIIVNDLDEEKGLRHQQALFDRGVQSFLILPVTINDHLRMVIYLENIFAKNWYVEERVRWVRIAANQGAIIIENARIHEKSIQLNEEIRKEMLEKERLASVLEMQKDAHLTALVQTQDNERKRIASDLHDSLGSLLSSVRLRLNSFQEEFENSVPHKATKFNDTLDMLDESIQELRNIAHNMLPVSLSRFGLDAALQTFLQHINTSEQLDVDLQILGLEERLPEQIEVSVYRICQELVQNVIKHASATSMRIQIIRHADALNIIVEDNGRGMLASSVESGFGFNTIRSKIDLFKGTFDIDSQPGKGTTILVNLVIDG